MKNVLIDFKHSAQIYSLLRVYLCLLRLYSPANPRLIAFLFSKIAQSLYKTVNCVPPALANGFVPTNES